MADTTANTFNLRRKPNLLVKVPRLNTPILIPEIARDTIQNDISALVSKLLGALQSEAHPFRSPETRETIDAMLNDISTALIKSKAGSSVTNKSVIHIRQDDINRAKKRYESRTARAQRKEQLDQLRRAIEKALDDLEEVKDAEDKVDEYDDDGQQNVVDVVGFASFARKRTASDAFCNQVGVVERLSKRFKASVAAEEGMGRGIGSDQGDQDEGMLGEEDIKDEDGELDGVFYGTGSW